MKQRDNYFSLKKIAKIKAQRKEKALRKRNKVKNKIDNKKKEITNLEEQLNQHKQFIDAQQNALWSGLVGKDISIREIDSVKFRIRKMHEQTEAFKEEIENEQTKLKELNDEYTNLHKRYIQSVNEEEKFKKVVEKFKVEYQQELIKQEDNLQ